MAECGLPRSRYNWHECDDFQIPENSVWFGNDESGSDIFCGKAWYDGQELPAKVIPERRESIVACDDGERVVTNCRKVLICDLGKRKDCSRERRHCHRGRRHCHRREDRCHSSSSDEEGGCAKTEIISESNKESQFQVKSMKSSSSTTTTTIKKHKKKHHHDHHQRCSDEKTCKQECWNEQRTRIVPRITYEPRVRYEPKVTMERRVRYEPERYVTRVCNDRCEDFCEDYCCEDICCEDYCNPCDPCIEPWHSERRRKEIISEKTAKSTDVTKEEEVVRSERSDSPKPSKLCF
ncbi:hypothetical protein WA026_017014 [Henosepilachna vigintioctopunctata]|uniref:Uncharacterized protein n=1 Tax=Henosepilachna vigintioctopunctata TaxID=420089 RepID=A0AAW1TPG5_9CUCU